MRTVRRACLAALLLGLPASSARVPQAARSCRDCPGRPVAGCGAGCACSIVRGANPNEGCAVQNVSGCVKRAGKLAVVTGVAIYRMGDLLLHQSFKWRRDSLAILAWPMFRGTLLREVLQRTSLHDGQSIAAWDDARVEAMASSVDEGFPGYSCATGVTGVNASAGLRLGEVDAQKAALFEAVAEKIRRGQCEKAPDSDLVVHLRMGDHGNIELNQALALRAAKLANATRIVVNGVISSGGFRRGFTITEETINSHAAAVDSLLEFFKQNGYSTAVRSDPDADSDLCYMAGARNLLRGSFGFARIVWEVREALPKLLGEGALPAAGSVEEV